ncbi:MAG: PepSY domain-containing protein [Acidimicrobiia bacterium]|nr:PepSY domain-containing protein [Acidimicrobiia bacterium]
MKRTRIIVGVAVAAVALGTGVSYAVAQSDDDGTEQRIVGADLERATAAALASTGGGRVTGTEVGDEESYYEVEVTLDDGSQVDVQLDRDFAVVGSSADHEDDTSDRD